LPIGGRRPAGNGVRDVIPLSDPAAGHAPVRAALAVLAPELDAFCVDPWYVIGSAALALHGVALMPADIDLLTSWRDAEAAMRHWADRRERSYAPADDHRFRSHFARFRFSPLPVEVMGELEVHGASGWQPLRVAAWLDMGGDGVCLRVLTTDELQRILHGFGRPKDLQRAALLARA
jgi:hypothetical protein